MDVSASGLLHKSALRAKHPLAPQERNKSDDLYSSNRLKLLITIAPHGTQESNFSILGAPAVLGASESTFMVCQIHPYNRIIVQLYYVYV